MKILKPQQLTLAQRNNSLGYQRGIGITRPADWSMPRFSIHWDFVFKLPKILAKKDKFKDN